MDDASYYVPPVAVVHTFVRSPVAAPAASRWEGMAASLRSTHFSTNEVGYTHQYVAREDTG